MEKVLAITEIRGNNLIDPHCRCTSMRVVHARTHRGVKGKGDQRGTRTRRDYYQRNIGMHVTEGTFARRLTRSRFKGPEDHHARDSGDDSKGSPEG